MQQEIMGWQWHQVDHRGFRAQRSKSKFFRKRVFAFLQVLLLDFTNTIWQSYIDFYTIRIVFESPFQLCIFKVANLKKLWQFWQNV